MNWDDGDGRFFNPAPAISTVDLPGGSQVVVIDGVLLDPDGLVEMANPAAQRLLGVTGKRNDQPTGPAWLPPESLRVPLKEAIQSLQPYLPEEFDHAVLLRRYDPYHGG